MQLLRPDSVEAAAAELGNGSVGLAGGTDLVPLLRDRIVEAETLVELRGVVPRGVQGTTIGAGTTLAELEADPEIPQALREACSLAASPQLRSMGTIGGNLLQATRCWYWRLKFPCFLHGGDTLPRAPGDAPRARDLRQRALRVRSPVRPGRGAARARHDAAHRPARAAAGGALPAADRGRSQRHGAGARRADPRARRPAAGGEHVPQGDGPDDVLVRARRRRGRALRRRRAAGAGRRGADSVAAGLARRPGAGDAPPRDRVQGRAGAPADPRALEALGP